MLALFAQGFKNNPNPDPAAQAAAGGFMMVCCGFYLAIIVLMIASLWKVFTKAGQPGWASIVPIYSNYIITCEIAKKEILWFWLEFVPFVNIYAIFVTWTAVARKFGKSEGFGVGLVFLPFIFWPMLAFGDARYQRNRRRRDDDDDDEEDDYDRPRRPRPDEDEEDDRPRRRPRRLEDD